MGYTNHYLRFHSSPAHFLPFIEVSLNGSSMNMIVTIAVLLRPPNAHNVFQSLQLLAEMDSFSVLISVLSLSPDLAKDEIPNLYAGVSWS